MPSQIAIPTNAQLALTTKYLDESLRAVSDTVSKILEVQQTHTEILNAHTASLASLHIFAEGQLQFNERQEAFNADQLSFNAKQEAFNNGQLAFNAAIESKVATVLSKLDVIITRLPGH